MMLEKEIKKFKQIGCQHFEKFEKAKILRTIAALRIFWWTIQDSNL